MAESAQQQPAPNIADAVNPAEAQAQQEVITNFLNTGSNTTPPQLVSGLFDINNIATSQFVTHIKDAPQQAGEAAAAPLDAAASGLGIASAITNVTSKPGWGDVSAAMERGANVPLNDISGLSRTAAEVSKSVANAAIASAEDLNNRADNILSNLTLQTQAVNAATAANATRKKAELAATLGPDYQNATQVATQNAMRLSAEAANFNAKAEDARSNGQTLKYMWYSALASQRRTEASTANADAQQLLGTVQQAISATVLKQGQDYDPQLAEAQAGLISLKDQLAYAKERGSLNTQVIDAAQKAAEAYQKLASGQMTLEQFKTQQEEARIAIIRGKLGITTERMQQGAIGLQMQSTKQDIKMKGEQYDQLVKSRTAADGLARIAGFRNGEELKTYMSTLPDQTRAMFGDVLARSWNDGKPKIDLVTYLAGRDPNDRQAILSQLHDAVRDPQAKYGISMLLRSNDVASATFNRAITGNPQAMAGLSPEVKKLIQQYGQAKGDKKQQGIIRQQATELLGSQAMQSPDFRAGFGDQLGFKKFGTMSQDYLKANKVDPFLANYLPHLKNGHDEIAASLEMQQAFKAAGVTSSDRINKSIAHLFSVYNRYLYSSMGASNFGLQAPSNYLVNAIRMPSLSLMGSGTNQGSEPVDMTSPLTQARISVFLQRAHAENSQANRNSLTDQEQARRDAGLGKTDTATDYQKQIWGLK